MFFLTLTLIVNLTLALIPDTPVLLLLPLPPTQERHVTHMAVAHMADTHSHGCTCMAIDLE